MSHHDQKVPRPVLAAAAGLMLLTIGVAAMAQGGITPREMSVALTPSGETTRAIRSRVLRVEDRPDGSVAVLSEDGALLSEVEPGTGGFIRGVLRGMNRARRLESIGPEPPFVLSESPDGSLLLRDPETERLVELRSFGRTNYETFAALLEMP